MADYTDFDPANLRAGLVKSDRSGLKPSLTTPLYSGTGTPTHWNQLKPSLRHADGTLRAGMLDANNELKGANMSPEFNDGVAYSLSVPLLYNGEELTFNGKDVVASVAASGELNLAAASGSSVVSDETTITISGV